MFSAVKTCQVLIDLGAEVDAVDADAHTPLHLAAKVLNAEVALALIRMGSSTAALDNKSRCPLHLALYHSDLHNFQTASRLVKTCEVGCIEFLVLYPTLTLYLTSLNSLILSDSPRTQPQGRDGA